MNSNVDKVLWQDWKWQFNNRLQNEKDFNKTIDLFPEEKEALNSENAFAVGVTPYYASLIDPQDPLCPIRLQAIPKKYEFCSSKYSKEDPLSEDVKSPVANVVHRYPDRIVLIVTETCCVYCRHCTRRRRVGFKEKSVNNKMLTKAINYIKANKEIRDVLITGGDPLTLSDQRLEEIIKELHSIESVEVIRIGSRIPITNPFRITDNLISMLQKYHPIWMNIQFNHPKEITPESKLACSKIIDGGIPLGNQTVLLRNINDSVTVQKKLVQQLMQIRVRPYYLYQCDLAEGIEHFRTPVSRGIEIIENLQGHTSGLAVPNFVIDAPGGGGKIPVNPQYVLSQSPEKTVLRNYEGTIYTYPEPKL